MFENVQFSFPMERRVRGNSHARCGAGEKVENGADAPFRPYLSLSAAKSQGIKQLMAGGGVIVLGLTLVPMLSTLF